MDGILIIDKPKGITSHDVVYMVRRLTGIKKVGHTGTLDPLATGVLPILIGKATKLSDRLVSHTKEYIAEFEFGFETDTLDITGEILNITNHIPKEEEVKKVLKEFEGEIMQVPPMYSAIKINGKKLYEYARAGEEIDIPSRKCNINHISLVAYKNNKYEILVNCSSGTYIRSLIRDIGRKLNSLATITELRRTKSGDFIIKDAINEDTLKNMTMKQIEDKLINIKDALKYEAIYLPIEDYKKITNGMICKTDKIYDGDKEYNIFCNGEYIGIGKYMFHNFWGIKLVKMLK